MPCRYGGARVAARESWGNEKPSITHKHNAKFSYALQKLAPVSLAPIDNPRREYWGANGCNQLLIRIDLGILLVFTQNKINIMDHLYRERCKTNENLNDFATTLF
jgi:hypothetical protein